MKTKILIGLILALSLIVFAIGRGTAKVASSFVASSYTSGTNLRIQNAPWFVETVRSGTHFDTGVNASIAYSDDNVPYISFYDAARGNLMLASPVSSRGNCGPGNTWFCRAVDTYGDVGRYSSIVAQGPANSVQLSIAYYDATNLALKYARWSCSPTCKWRFTIVDRPGSPYEAGRYACLKLDSTGTPHIAYSESRSSIHPVGRWSGLRYASYVGSGGNCGKSQWRCETIDSHYIVTSFGAHASLDFNGQNSPRIAYYDGYSSQVKLAVFQGEAGETCLNTSQWKCYALDDVSTNAFQSLFIGIRLPEKPMIAYYDRTNRQLKFASLSQSGGNCGPIVQGNQLWRCDVIDVINAPLPQAGIAVTGDQQGFPIIGYINRSGEQAPVQLETARPVEALGLTSGNCGPKNGAAYTWQCSVIDPDLAGSGNSIEGVSVSNGVNQAGLAGLAYQIIYSDQAGDLKFARQSLASWFPLILK